MKSETLKVKIYFQEGCMRNTKWLTVEVRDKQGRNLYRARRLAQDEDITSKEFIFDFWDHEVDYTQEWKEFKREELAQLKMEKVCKPEKKSDWIAI